MKDFPARAAKIYQASLNRYKHDSSMHTAAIRQYLSQWVREEEEGHMMLCVCVELTARVPTVQESNPELQHRPKRRQSESGASGKPDFSRSASQPVSRMKREVRVTSPKHTFEGPPNGSTSSSATATTTTSTTASKAKSSVEPMVSGKGRGPPVDDALSRLASTEVQRPHRHHRAAAALRVPHTRPDSPMPQASADAEVPASAERCDTPPPASMDTGEQEQ